ncbi:MAG: hypothetical protein HY681_10060 [Chloroflexi bacterium]|nr:hypothetical protein [Chloroflexota bacterium]
MTAQKSRFTIDLDPLFQRRLKATAALKGMTMREYCLLAIEKELARDETGAVQALPFGEEALDRLDALRDLIFQGRTLEGDSVELLREARAERTKAL